MRMFNLLYHICMHHKILSLWWVWFYVQT
jgi:hypothetical protein